MVTLPPVALDEHDVGTAVAFGGGGGGRNATINPETSTGVVRSLVVPSPSSPYSFRPQHFTLPSVSTAHEWSPPRAMLVAFVIFKTSTGAR